MRTFILAAALTIVALAGITVAQARTCTTQCFGNTCTTTCF
jgi:hypothetical protein